MRTLLILLAGGLVCLSGCGGPDVQTFCEDAESCVGGNEADIEACVIQTELYLDFYDEIGCGSEYDDYFDCAIEASSCQDLPAGQNCMSNQDCGNNGGRCQNNVCTFKTFGLKDPESCETEQNAASRCGDLD